MYPFFRHLRLTVATLSCCILTATVWAAPAKPQLQVTGYVINAELDPAANKLSATAVVSFTALEDLTAPVFELNNGLQISKVTTPTKSRWRLSGLPITLPFDSTWLRPSPRAPALRSPSSIRGHSEGSETSPVEGINLASVEDPISILLYPGRWFPMVGLYTDRFTAEMHIRVPGDERVVGSGSGVAAQKSLPGNRTEYTFNWSKPGFPGTIMAGKFLDRSVAGNMQVYVTEKHKDVGL